MYKAIIKRVAKHLCAWDAGYIAMDEFSEETLEIHWDNCATDDKAEFLQRAAVILSIREPDPEGRYAVKVVDLKVELPECPDYGYGVAAAAWCQKIYGEAMLKAGFVKEIKEATDGR